MAVSTIITGALTELGEATGALGAAGAFATPLLEGAGILVGSVVGIVKIIDLVKSAAQRKYDASLYVNNINKNYNDITLAIKNTKLVSIDTEKAKVASILFPTEIDAIIKINNNFATLIKEYATELSKIQSLISNGKLLVVRTAPINFVLVQSNLYGRDEKNNQFSSQNDIASVFKTIGLVSQDTKSELRLTDAITFSINFRVSQITDITNLIKLINQINALVQSFNDAINDMFILSSAVATLSDGTNTTSLEDLLEELLLNEETLSPYLRNLLDTLLRSLSLTKLKEYDEDENDKRRKRRKKCTPVMQMLGMCYIEQNSGKDLIRTIEADVSHRSGWIGSVKFRFTRVEEMSSNARGHIIFTLKSGNIYDLGIVARGSFSYIVTLMLGTGYGWWTGVPNRKRQLTDPETISKNLPQLTTAKRLKAIDTELETEGITYK